MTEDELILIHILQCSRSELYLRKPQLTIKQQEQVETYKSRRQNGDPLQYILGVANFMGLDFKVDSRVLIPRPETEILVDEAIQRMNPVKDAKILDLGTGSGNITVSLAKFLPEAHVTTVDISKDALDVARENALRHGVNGRINFVQADMMDYLTAGTSQLQFDLIISNPPYIPEDQMKTLPKDVLQEPELALKAGKDGLIFYRDIIQYSPSLLRQGAYLMMEFGDDQGFAIQELLLKQKDFIHIQMIKDLAGRDRIMCAQKR
ncbi:MAG: peptide chain release factor N(5)-glutamine methyltransferase [Candidatus Omnitrophica bacterium]|nr:peptide chain release factor N(5)-glutamine methyltransferase [Candidatus Omnitrophota bacterium]